MATTFQEALDRQFPTGRTFYCTKCRCCEVTEMGDMCVFCEDGVPCVKAKLKLQKTSVAPPATKHADEGLQQREAQIDELRSALINQGWRLPRAKSVAARVVDDHPDATFEERFRGIMSGNFGSEFAPLKTKMQHSGPRIKPVAAVAENTGQAVKREKEETVATETKHSRVKKEFDVEQYKKLVAKGMEQRSIAAEMGIGYSTLSTKLNQARAAGKLSKDVRAVRPPSNSPAKKELRKAAAPAAKPATNGHSNGGAVATLTVSESALDNFWSKLPIEEKARIVQDNLIGALGQ